MTIHPLLHPEQIPTSLARSAVRAFSYAGYQLRRRDRSGDIYPVDESAGRVPGPSPERVIVIGEATAVGYGVLTHELGMAAQFARQLSVSSGRGVDWSSTALPDNMIGSAPALVREMAAQIATADVVIVVVGIVDTLSLTTSTAWGRHLAETLDELISHARPGAHILVPEIPPLSSAGAIPPLVRWASSHQARLLNSVSASVVALRPRVRTVGFPAGLDNQLWKTETCPAAYRTLYAAWAAAILDVVRGESRMRVVG
jgi:hypothetical protein